jgi:hypothetical protein
MHGIIIKDETPNIQPWSREGSNVTAVPRPWTGVIVKADNANIRALVHCDAATRNEANRKLAAVAAPGFALVASFFGDHAEAILDTLPLLGGDE